MSRTSGPTIDGKRAVSDGDDPARVINRQGRLGDVGQLLRIFYIQLPNVLDRLHQVHLGRHLTDCAFYLGVTRMPDQHDFPVLACVAATFVMNLGDQRAGRIDHRQPTIRRCFLDALGDAVSGKHRHRSRRNFIKLIDEHRAPSPQILHDMPVVHDFVTHVDRRSVFLQRAFDDFDCPLDAGAEAAGLG